MPLHLGAFALSNSERTMNNFIHATDGVHTNDEMMFFTLLLTHYTLKEKLWDKLDKIGLVGKNLLQSKNVYGDGGIFYGFLLEPKIKYRLTIIKHGTLNEHKTFKGFTNVFDNSDRKEYFKMLDGIKLVAKVPLS